MKYLLAGLLSALFLVVPGAALAHHQPDHDGGDPCENGNQTDLCGGNVTVVPPTEVECPTGGIVVVVGGVRYPVCNGAPGQNGTNGTDGANGQDGAAGIDGVDGTDGLNGGNGVSGVNGRDGTSTTVVVEDVCVSSRVAKLRIKRSRGDRIRGLKVKLDGERMSVAKRNARTWVARIDLRGKERGVYGARVIYLKNGERVEQVHLYRACYPEVTESGASLNRRPIVRL